MQAPATVIRTALNVSTALLYFVANLISIAACAYGVWFVLSDLAHFNFTRGVVLFFCLWLGAMAVAMVVVRVRFWAGVLTRRA